MIAWIALLTVSMPASLYDFTVNDIDGKATPLKKFEGKVVVVVNVASKCGLTPQYDGLQKLYTDHKGKGLVVLGFPANNFGGQEPGSEAEIKQFCTGKYNVTFPMFGKISVRGEDTHPLYQWLLRTGPRPEEIEWNFAKFIIGRDGKVKHRFGPRVRPDADEFLAAIKSELDKS